MAREDGYLSSKTIVRNLLADVNEFQSAVDTEIASLSACADSLGEAWSDAQYRQFRSYIDDLTSSLKSDLKVLEEAVMALEREER